VWAVDGLVVLIDIVFMEQHDKRLPDQIKVFSGPTLLLEQAPFCRWIQPAPSIRNTAKILAVYEKQHDGLGVNENLRTTVAGSPILLKPGLTYVVTTRLNKSVNEVRFDDQRDPSEGGVSMVLISDQPIPQFAHDRQLAYFTTEATRIPTVAGAPKTLIRIPNPGFRRAGFVFLTNVAGVVADLVAVYDIPSGTATFITSAQTVLAAQPQSTPALGTALIAPVEWQVVLTAAGPGLPSSVSLRMSFHDEA
jgi:hypothetical protein